MGRGPDVPSELRIAGRKKLLGFWSVTYFFFFKEILRTRQKALW